MESIEQLSLPPEFQPRSAPPTPLDSANAILSAHSDEARKRESDAIARAVEEELLKRNAVTPKAPEYVARMPKSLREKLRVTPDEEEEILYAFASKSSIPRTASATRLPLEKVRAVVYDPELQGNLEALRNEMRMNVIRKIEETQTAILETIQDPRKLEDSSLTQLASVFETISSTQLSLLSAARELAGASRPIVDPAKIFSGDELEYLALLRRKVEASPTALAAEVLGEEDFSPSGHDFVDTVGTFGGPVPEILDAETSPPAERGG